MRYVRTITIQGRQGATPKKSKLQIWATMTYWKQCTATTSSLVSFPGTND
jgi:hypothetical protein